jgi:hypothetical protein
MYPNNLGNETETSGNVQPEPDPVKKAETEKRGKKYAAMFVSNLNANIEAENKKSSSQTRSQND